MNVPRIRLAISPCPNDTFIFHAISEGHLFLPGVQIETVFEDVETLNQAARNQTFDITKLSFHAYLLVQEHYHLLRTGAALGFGCGPLIVAPTPLEPTDLAQKTILVPGELTTAHLLLRLFSPKSENKQFVRYDDVIPMLLAGEADAGVIIHEDRFLFETKGLHKVADLGEWWETETGAPIPLGCIAMRRSIADDFAEPFDALVRKSIQTSRNHPETVLSFIRAHAQSMERPVLEKHIATFVNEYSMDLGAAGDTAMAALYAHARRVGILP